MRYQILWQPSDQQTVEDVSLGDTAILLQITEPTQTYLQKLTLDNGKVVKSQSLHPSGMPHLQISPVPNRKDSWWIEAQSALHSGSNFLLGKKHPTPVAEREFDFSDQYEVQHLWTDSNAEGKIPVPYLVVKSKNLNPDVPAPTIIEVYGGFDTAAAPNFSKELIDLWLRHGGVYVYAMVHGSAERGWRANDLTKVPSDIGAVDTITVAEDLIKRKITNAEHIGLNGRSAGGRWIALASLMRPDLFKAVVCTVCMLDFVSYTNWGYNQVYTSEYGDPRDPAQLPSLLKYSAMHYPVPENTPLPSYLMITSSTDDRVPPAHSRRFAKRMQDLGAEAYLLELAEGGHTLFANYNVLQTVDSAEWSFFQTKLDLKIPRSEQ